MKIQGREISGNAPPYIIAELSANHNGSLESATRIVKLAKECGADAIKLQTYTPDTITLDSSDEDFLIRGGRWDGRNLYGLYQEAHLPWNWHKPLFEYAKTLGVTIFSSPFDRTAVDLLEDLNCPAYKIASFEAIDLPLIKYAAGTGKPLIISTGMADVEEVQQAIEAAQEGGCKELAILRCVSAYPAPAKDYNLKTIPDMISRFGLVTGLSDHTLDNTVAIASVVMGASIIEKHFTLDRNGGGPDDSFSLEPTEFTELCQKSRIAWEAIGEVDYGMKHSEQGNIKFRRSLYWVTDLPAGSIINETSFRSVRPGYGIPPKYYEDLLGRKLKVEVKYGTPTRWDDFDE